MKKSIIILLLFLLTQFVCAGVASLISRLSVGSSISTDAPIPFIPEIYGVALFFGNIVLVALLWLLGLIRHRPFSSALPIRRLGEAVSGTLLLAFGLSLLGTLFRLPDNGMTDVFASMRHNPFCLLLLCFVGPLAEEFVFREGMMRNLMTRSLSPVRAAAVCALVFGLVHGNVAQALPAVVLGFVFGIFYMCTQDIRLCGLVHVLNNTFAVLLLFFPQVDTFVQALPVTVQAAAGVVLVGAASVLLADWWRRTQGAYTKKR